MVYLPPELWSKIYMFTIVVDESHHKLLSDIRKSKKIRILESKYKVIFKNEGTHEYWNWLHNDICGWINDYEPMYFVITDNMKNFYKREFNINVTSNDDIDRLVENKPNGGKYPGKYLWKKYVCHLNEDEFEDFYITSLQLADRHI